MQTTDRTLLVAAPVSFPAVKASSNLTRLRKMRINEALRDTTSASDVSAALRSNAGAATGKQRQSCRSLRPLKLNLSLLCQSAASPSPGFILLIAFGSTLSSQSRAATPSTRAQDEIILYAHCKQGTAAREACPSPRAKRQASSAGCYQVIWLTK